MSRQATKMRKRKRQQAVQDSLTKLAPGLVLDVRHDGSAMLTAGASECI